MKLQICFVIDNDNYKDNARKIDRKDSGMQEHLYKHFQTEGHKGFLIETSVTFIDETDEKGQKKERERKILDADIMGNTIEPYGLNIAGSV